MKVPNSIKYCHIPEGGDKSFFFDYVHIPCNEQISLHQQKTWELSYIICGKGMRVIGDMIEPFGVGEVIFIPPNIPHYWSFDESSCDNQGKIENITLTFPTDLLDNIKHTFTELSGIIDKIIEQKTAVSFGGDTLLKIQHLLLEMKKENTIERLSSLIKVLALASSPETVNIVGYPVVEDRKSKNLQKVYMYVMDNFQFPIKLEDIATHINMEKSTFCIFFRKATGKSFFPFLIEYRINVACDMLLKTKKTISEICFASGFRDIPYFNRVFKKQKTLTPKQYREQVINV